MNWDVVGYVASARSFENSDPEQIHKEIYALLKNSVTEEKYIALTSSKIGLGALKDAESLRQHLPFYQIRIVYTGAIYTLWKIGMNPFFASHLISVISVVLAVWLLAFLWPNSRNAYYTLLIPFITGAANMAGLARLSTPDALATLLVILYFWLLVRHHKSLPVLLPVGILVRTDLILILALFYLYLLWKDEIKKQTLLVSALIAGILFFAINAYYDNYGWSRLFYYSFIEKTSYPVDYPNEVNLFSYIYVLISRTPSLLMDGYFPIFIISTFLGIYILYQIPEKSQIIPSVSNRDIFFILTASLVYVLLHFVLFPTIWFRFFSAQYALNIAILITLILQSGGQIPDK